MNSTALFDRKRSTTCSCGIWDHQGLKGFFKKQIIKCVHKTSNSNGICHFWTSWLVVWSYLGADGSKTSVKYIWQYISWSMGVIRTWLILFLLTILHWVFETSSRSLLKRCNASHKHFKRSNKDVEEKAKSGWLGKKTVNRLLWGDCRSSTQLEMFFALTRLSSFYSIFMAPLGVWERGKSWQESYTQRLEEESPSETNNKCYSGIAARCCTTLAHKPLANRHWLILVKNNGSQWGEEYEPPRLQEHPFPFTAPTHLLIVITKPPTLLLIFRQGVLSLFTIWACLFGIVTHQPNGRHGSSCVTQLIRKAHNCFWEQDAL